MPHSLPLRSLLFLPVPLALAFIGACSEDDPVQAPAAAAPDASTLAEDAGTTAPADASQGDLDAGHDAEAAPDANVRATITGKIVWRYANVEGAKVVIGDKTATSDAKGSFTIADVSIPYDLQVIVPPGSALGGPTEAPAVFGFVGLSTTTPVLSAAAKVTYSKATFTGTLSGGTSSSQNRYRTVASNPMSPPAVSYGGESNAPSKTYELTASWPLGQSSETVNLIGIEYTIAPGQVGFEEGIPTSYGFGISTPAKAENGKSYTGQLPPLAVLGQKTIQGSFVHVAGVDIRRHLLRLVSKDGATIEFNQASTSDTFDYKVPDFDAFATVQIGAVASTGTGDYIIGAVSTTGGTSGIKVDLMKAPELTAPEDNAAGFKAGDMLSWTSGGDDCLYNVYISSPVDGATQFQFVTKETSLKLPDLSTHGAALAASTSHKWSVSCLHQGTPKADIDASLKLGVSYLSSSSTPARSLLTL